MSENDELLSKISRIAGQINRQRDQPPQDQTLSRLVKIPNKTEPYQQSHKRGYKIQKLNHSRKQTFPAHRNRSLVVKNAKDSIESTAQSSISHFKPEGTSQSSDQSYKSPYGDTFGSLRSGLLQSHLGISAQASKTNVIPPRQRQQHSLVADGLRYAVSNEGRELVRDYTFGPSHLETPNELSVNGVRFLRTEKGRLTRAKIASDVRNLSTAGTSRPPCGRFTAMGIWLLSSCSRGSRCPFLHDPQKVAICKDLLRSGKCPRGRHCDLSHHLTYERVPACLHHLRGSCTKADCPYPHVHLQVSARVCAEFARLGFCERGIKCPDRHAFECPDYAELGKCDNFKCRLPHVDRARLLRQQGLDRVSVDGRPPPSPIPNHIAADNDSLGNAKGVDSGYHASQRNSSEAYIHNEPALEQDFIHL